jgi:hypothetical protein
MGSSYSGRKMSEVAAKVSKILASLVGGEIAIVSEHEVTLGIAIKFNHIPVIKIFLLVQK